MIVVILRHKLTEHITDRSMVISVAGICITVVGLCCVLYQLRGKVTHTHNSVTELKHASY